MIRLSRYLLRKLFKLFLWFVILIGLLVGGLQLLLPYSDAYRDQVAAWLGGMLGQEVGIGAMHAGWRGLGPELVLHGLRLGPPGEAESSLHLDELRVEFALLDSLRDRRPTVRRVAVRGASLRITRQPDGCIMTSDLAQGSKAEKPPAGSEPAGGYPLPDQGGCAAPSSAGGRLALSALPARLDLLQSEIVWHDRMRGREPVRLTELNITVRNDGFRHQAKADFRLEGGRLELAAELVRQDETASGWSADFYLKGEELPFKRANDWLPEGYRLAGRYQRIEAWSRWEHGEPQDLEGSVELRGLGLATPHTADLPIHLDQLGAKFRWQAEAGGGRLDLADLGLGPHRLGAISARLRRDGEQVRLEAGFDDQKIEGLLAALESSVGLAANARDALAGLQPHGGLEGLRVEALGGPEGVNWSLTGGLRDLQTRPWGDIPGITNLSGAFRAGPEGGAFQLAGREVAVSFLTLFRDPLQLAQVGGLIQWGRGDRGSWVLDAPALVAENADIHTRTRLRLEFPPDPDASPFLDLQTDFEEGDASTTHKYLPTGIMDEDVVAWLDRAILSGRVLSGACIVRGTLRDFPYQENDRGRFEVLFDVADMKLDYWPGWPPITELAARVRFWNDRFDVWVGDGRIFDSRLKNTRGWIDRLSQSSPFELDGGAAGPLADQLRLLRESPLKEDFSSLTEGVKGKGNAELKLAFGIPLDQGKFHLDGRLKLRNATLQKEGYADPLTAINGEIRFDDKGVKARAIKGQLRKAPVSLDLEPIAARPGSTLATATTRMDPVAWQEKIPELLRPRLKGSTEVQVQLELPPLSAGPDEPIRLRVASTLEGLAIDLPAPAGKSEELHRPLRMETQLGGKGALPLEFGWGDLLAGSLRFDRPAKGSAALAKGAVRIGPGKAPALPDKGLHIIGKLEQLRLDPWLELVSGAPKGDEKGAGPFPLPDRIDLEAGWLRLGEEELKGFRIELASAGEGLAGRIVSDRIKGALFLPGRDERTPPVVRLAELRLEMGQDASDPPDPEQPSARDPRGLRGLDLQSEKVIVNGRDFGPLTLLALPVERGVEIRTLELGTAKESLAGTGEWLYDGPGVHTRIDLKLKSPALGELLAALGYTPQMKGGAAELALDLRWPGDPAGFTRKGLNGTIGMQIGGGTLEEVEPGFGRVFGLINFAALARRLRLDFRDMFGKGFSFDRISGNFRLEGGDAHTDDLRLESPAARIELQGRIGLADRDFDQTATITGHLSSALPIAGAVVGGPAVGAALFLAQRVAGDRMDSLSSIKYKVTGPWEEPQVTRITAPPGEGHAPDLEGMER